MKNKLGQYFTTNKILQEKIFQFILNKPDVILEPSIGKGHLVQFVQQQNKNITFHMYEIDSQIQFLDSIPLHNLILHDFLTYDVQYKYHTIIGNPPYVKTSKNNLYIQFIEKCYNLLHDNGELIFIVPSDFLKLTSASNILNIMIQNGTFTHIFHPNNENMFDNANIDIIVFRYCKNNSIDKITLYNDQPLHLINNQGLITFSNQIHDTLNTFSDYFNIYVGMVSGKENVFKNSSIGNIQIINGHNKIDKYIFIDNYPSNDNNINQYLLSYKDSLINRKIRKFNESNWYQWGAPRNIQNIHKHMHQECIYIYNLTRNDNVAFLSKVNYFGGSLIALVPKKKCNLNNILSYINSHTFKQNFMFSGRFKIGHRQISNSIIPTQYLT